ncbi:MFS transporter, PHS family, inorganic phosphate transporter [Galdieria sulphuraria]|uniref:MFS transporter, PHS family, inorganic phosphate transporter n=1 Tax=Galdieria sulphuraria TaxID=130081 RepID=M2XJA6_GALSU|nr:MFS transporter, PHS family, inorganic phosphate transporter [Galdieria sulphuraria]EME30197.1 MFS transporter, PHS family, inorganic phosphate transporter [Galdieria sulphuraria]|eukprot:XP_005706717.1 MFS transporter, PHS family, inorganic phosphate transporter [Galdieria sulphuraria]
MAVVDGSRIDEEVNKLKEEADVVVQQRHAEEEKLYGGFRSPIINTLVSGVGFFTDAYNIFIVSILNGVWTEGYPDAFTSTMKTRVSNSILVGDIVGMLFFGLFADRIGRKAGLLSTATILLIGPILETVSFGANGSQTGMFWMLVIVRGFLGVGIGGEYPCAATTSCEAGEDAKIKRGKNVLLVFAMQGVGTITAYVYGIMLIEWAKANPSNFEPVWRVALASSIVPVIPIYILRWRMRNSTRYEIAGLSRKNLPWLLVLRKYWVNLIGTAGTWFINDFLFYSNGLFSSEMTKSILEETDVRSSNLVFTEYTSMLILLIGLPGYFVSAFTADYIGSRNIQIIGAVMSGVIAIIMGGIFNLMRTNPGPFIMMYGLFFFFTQFGANCTTFILPTETYATAVRATLHGVSAAFGKTGAAIGTQVFNPLKKINPVNGPRAVFIFCGGLSLIGAIVTYICIPDNKNKSLETIDMEFERYCLEHGVELKYLQPTHYSKYFSASDSDEKARTNGNDSDEKNSIAVLSE